MPKLRTKYNTSWEKMYPFIKPGRNEYEAHCRDCDHHFRVSSGGKADISRHINSVKHKKQIRHSADALNESMSNDVVRESDTANDANNNTPQLSKQDLVIKAETMQALKVVSSNYAFASTSDDGDRFRVMFPDSSIAENYQMSRTKTSYVIKHGIAPFVKEQAVEEFRGTPFVFKFDETTTIQTKKQYDAYVQFWSAQRNLVTSVYCGSIFVGHCAAKDLMHHFQYFGEQMNWNPDLLLQVGMDGPSVNLKFEKDLAVNISEMYGSSFINLGSCSLHQTHNAFRKGILSFGFEFETFINDTSYFFKLSAARRQDYELMHL